MNLLPVDDAIARIVRNVAPLAVEEVPLRLALGRTLGAPLAATRTQPPFPASAMDGFAVRAADIAHIPAELTIVGVAAAGHGFKGTLGPGEAVRLSTGAPVPDGSDTVLIKENAETRGTDKVIAKQSEVSGRHIRQSGLDFREGDVLLAAGRHLGVRELTLAAAMNHATVPVRRRPKVAILATGDELVSPGDNPGPDQIISSNDLGLTAFVERNGGEARDLGIVSDDTEAIAKAIEAALEIPADILVTIGGASVGDHDFVQDALLGRGMKLDFWRIAMRPGKPLMFGTFERARVLGLPGNPVSSLVCALLFLKPLISSLLGAPLVDPSEPARLNGSLKANDKRQDYLRATLAPGDDDGLPVATVLSSQDSSGLRALATADCLIIRPPNAPPGQDGDPCRVIRLDRTSLF